MRDYINYEFKENSADSIIRHGDSNLKSVYPDLIGRSDGKTGSTSKALYENDLCNTNTPDRTRTCYPLLRRQMLYPHELRGHL